MTVITTSEDKKIECTYNSKLDNTNFTLTLPSGRFGFIKLRIKKYDLDDLISTLRNFDEMMRATGQIKL